MLTYDEVKQQQGAPTTLPPISSATLNPQQPVQLPPLPPPTDTSGFAAALDTHAGTINDTIKSLTPAPTQADQAQNSLLDSIASLTGKDTGKQSYQIQQENQFGLPDSLKQLTDVNGQIQSGMAELNKMTADAEAAKNALPTAGITSGVYFGQQAQIDRQNASLRASKAAEIGLLQARAAGLNGNIQTAQSLATRAVDMKYAPIEDALKVQKAQLDALAPILDKEQKTQALAQQRVLQQQQQAVQDKKDQEKQVQNIMLNAAQSGADANTLAKIQSAGSVPDAISAAGESLGADYKMKVQQQAFDNNVTLQKLMIDKAQLAISQRKAASDSGMSEGDLIAYAQQYAATGNIPTGLPKGTFGAISQVAGSLPKAPGTIVSTSTGVVPPSAAFSNAQSDGLSATYNLITNVLPALKTSFGSVTTNPGTGLFNALRLRTGDVTDYNSKRTNFLNALLLANSGKVVSETELKRYQSLIPSLSTVSKGNGVKQLDNLQKELTDKLNSYLANNQLSIVGYDPKNPQGFDVGKAANFDK